jgi:anti-sigma regulatory factor (Ser/Thr protein kinase)
LGEVRFTISARPAAVAEARHRVKALEGLPDERMAEAELVVSELVTNSVLHAGLSREDAIEVAVRREAPYVVIEVDDGDGLFARRGEYPAGGRPGGMGLKMLDAICDHWHAEAGRVIAALRI